MVPWPSRYYAYTCKVILFFSCALYSIMYHTHTHMVPWPSRYYAYTCKVILFFSCALYSIMYHTHTHMVPWPSRYYAYTCKVILFFSCALYSIMYHTPLCFIIISTIFTLVALLYRRSKNKCYKIENEI